MLLKNYPYWRDEKLKNFQNLDNCWVEINNPKNLSSGEKNKIKQLCKTNNFALIQTKKFTKYNEIITNINYQLGLITTDKHFYTTANNLTKITKTEDKTKAKFIPYTNKKINWHTDGYYNNYDNLVRSFSLFCVNPAKQGGENKWLDIEMLYILLYEKDKKLTELLTLKNIMTIPAFIKEDKILRKESNNSIFLIDKKTKSLYMRYTQRKKNIIFKNEVLEAINMLNQTLEQDSDYHFNYKMEESQGIINNNVIHTRNSFKDNKNNPRLMLRGRYFVRV